MVSLVFMFALFVGFLGLCNGVPNPARIVGGSPTTIQAYPSIVQIEDFYPPANVWFQMCGGNILTNNIVLSAAHCFSLDVSMYRIKAGATYLDQDGVIVYISSVLIHPYYGDPFVAADADICIIRLSGLLTFGNTINYTSIIPQNWDIPNNAPGIYAGWGFLATDVFGSEVLRHVNVSILDHENCERTFQGPIHHDVVCAGYSGRGVCWGDSGGPLYYGGVLAGIISWTPDCGHPYLPSGNIRVASYTDWIVANA